MGKARQGGRRRGARRLGGKNAKTYQLRKMRMKESPESFSEKICAEGAKQRMWLQAQNIAKLEARQRSIWSWTVTLAILLFFVLFAIEAGAWVGWLNAPNAREEELIFWADMLAILVIALDLAGRYRYAANKMLFFRENWLTIIAILPIGLMFRVGAALESLQLLSGVQAFARMEEVALLAPIARMVKGAHVAAEGQRTLQPAFELSSLAGKLMMDAWRATANYSVVTDFIELSAKWVGRAARLVE